MDPKVKKDNLERMYNEGVEMATSLLKLIESLQTDKEYNKLDNLKKMRYIRSNNKEFDGFIQIHPIVAQYIITESIFNRSCFKKYINVVYGYEKSKEDMEFLAKDPKNVYFYKNRQYALYTKFLMREYNKHIDQSVINNAYNDMVEELNSETRKQFEIYEKKKMELDMLDTELNEEKKREFIEFLQNQYA